MHIYKTNVRFSYTRLILKDDFSGAQRQLLQSPLARENASGASCGPRNAYCACLLQILDNGMSTVQQCGEQDVRRSLICCNVGILSFCCSYL